MSKIKNTPRQDSGANKNRHPELPLAAIGEIADWLLDLACRGADGDQDELATVERVRRAVHRGLAGRPIRQLSEHDVVTVASLLATYAERDLGLEGVGAAMAVGYDAVDHAPRHGAPIDVFERAAERLAEMVLDEDALELAAAPPHRTSTHRGPRIATFRRCVP
jgi:hypothetical protein